MDNTGNGDMYALTDAGRKVLKSGIGLFLGTARPIDKTILRYLSSFEEGRTYEQISSTTKGKERLLWGYREVEITPEYVTRSLNRLLKWNYIEIV